MSVTAAASVSLNRRFSSGAGSALASRSTRCPAVENKSDAVLWMFSSSSTRSGAAASASARTGTREAGMDSVVMSAAGVSLPARPSAAA